MKDKRNDGWSVFLLKATVNSTFFNFINFTAVDCGSSENVKRKCVAAVSSAEEGCGIVKTCCRENPTVKSISYSDAAEVHVCRKAMQM